MMNPSLNRMVLGTVAVLWVVLVTPVMSAQEPASQAPASNSSPVTDTDLRAFAGAYVEYHKIRQVYEAQLDKIQDPKEKEKTQREGDVKVRQALEKQKLTPESYNRLFTAINGNEQLRRKAITLINEERNRS